jgi:AraC family transcriptional regulator
VSKLSGFAAVQSFTRAFRLADGVSPGEYRKESEKRMYDVTIRIIPAVTALTYEHIGPYMKIGRAFDRLHTWFVAHDALNRVARMIALYYDDPMAVPEDQLRSRAGIVLTGGEPLETPFEPVTIHGGTYAVLRHKGPYAELARAYQWLYGEWLPKSGRDAADAPVFEEYLNTPQNAAPSELLTDICLPLQ